MPVIEIETIVNAPLEVCFDLSRSIDLHKISTEETNEKAIDGVTTGLIALDEFVTWEAVHFGVKQKLTSKITSYGRPNHFRDEQVQGIFKYIIHDHYFYSVKEGVMMKDVFSFKAPLGFLGFIAEELVLTKYLKTFLIKRNAIIKAYAESGKYKTLLTPDSFS
jgi:ligand-binding SRPBCC domain-containing protein